MNEVVPLVMMSRQTVVSRMGGGIPSLFNTKVDVTHEFKQSMEQCQILSTMSSSIDNDYLVRKVVLIKLLKHI
jgi:hypothetical protein